MIQSIQDLLGETVAAEEREERCRMEEAELEAELRGLEAGEERRGSNASQVVELLPGHGGRAAVHYGNGKSEVYQFELLREKLHRRFEAQTLQCKGQEKKKEERRMKKSKSKGKFAC